MPKNSKKDSIQKKIVVVVFVEGDTEVEFYKKLINHLRSLCGGRLSCEVKIHNLKGVGNYQSTAKRIFEKKIKQDYPANTYEYKVFLSYDTDVFEFARKPLVNWKTVISLLKTLGANEVYEIQAKSSIEDWFLYDRESIRSFLNISKNVEISKCNGLSGLKSLFQKVNKTYVKGLKSTDLVDSLNMNVIFPKICCQIYTLCHAVGLNCDGKQCTVKR